MSQHSEVRWSLFKAAGRKFYSVEWRDHVTNKLKRRSTGETTKKAAMKEAARIIDDVENGRLESSTPTTWAALVERFELAKFSGLAPDTQYAYRRTVALVKEHIDPHLIRSMGAAELEKLWAKLRERMAENTVRKHQRHLHAILNYAVDIGAIHRMPFMEAKQTDGAKGRRLTGEEIDRFKDAARALNGDRAESWVHLIDGLLLSGLRISEALEATWDDYSRIWIDWSRKHPIMVIPKHLQKSKKHSEIPITPEFLAFLQETPEDQRCGFLFNPKGKTPERLSANRVSRYLADCGRKAGIIVKYHPDEDSKHEFASAHDLRRSFGFSWARRVPAQVLQFLMRHKSITTTMEFYAGLNADEVAESLFEAKSGQRQRFTDTSTDTTRKTPREAVEQTGGQNAEKAVSPEENSLS